MSKAMEQEDGIKIILMVLLISLMSCGLKQECPQLDYSSLEIDTTKLLEDQVFTNENDSIIIDSYSYIVDETRNNQYIQNENGCAHGIFLTYRSRVLDFEINYYFLAEANNSASVVFNSYHFESIEFQNVKNANEINTTIFTTSSTTKILEINIVNGQFVSFRDNQGKFWKNLN